MKTEHRVLVFLVSAGMELCYLYAGATFVTTAVFHQPFPFLQAIGSFLAAALLTRIADGRGWRVVFVVLIQSIGFIPALLIMSDVFHTWAGSFTNQTWLIDYFSNPADAIDYFVYVLLFAWTLMFWATGVGFARRQNDYTTLGARLDRGLIVFFALFLAKFYLQAALGIHVDESTAGFFVIPFLLTSLLAIGLARSASAAQRDFMPGYQTIGVLLGFIVVVLLAGSGLVFFFLPYLTLAAQKGNDVLTVVSVPFVSMLFAITTALFGNDFGVNNAPSETAPPLSSSQATLPAWLESIGRMMAWGVGIIVALVLLAVVGGLLYSILVWLVSKTPLDPEKSNERNPLTGFVDFARAVIHFFKRILGRRKYIRPTVRLYAALKSWGIRSGSPHALDETPSEYGARLGRRFPQLAQPATMIVEAFNREVYGERSLDQSQLVAAQSAWRAMAHPRYWLTRFKAWFQ